MLKADMHIHTSEDPQDGKWLKHSAKDFIGFAAQKGYQVISITCHKKVVYSKQLAAYAKSKGILLIPGVEWKIGKRDVLIYNITQQEAEKIKTFGDLRKLRQEKKDNILIMAPHPYLPAGHSIGKELVPNIDLFDAIELCHFYTWTMNWNKKAVAVAKRFKKPMFGNSDVHYLSQLGKTYTLIDSKHEMGGVFSAIRQGRVSVKTKPLSHLFYGLFVINMLSIRFRRDIGIAWGKIYKL
jgi:predicted metal-dependent phosphoesterase TrpH